VKRTQLQQKGIELLTFRFGCWCSGELSLNFHIFTSALSSCSYCTKPSYAFRRFICQCM